MLKEEARKMEGKKDVNSFNICQLSCTRKLTNKKVLCVKKKKKQISGQKSRRGHEENENDKKNNNFSVRYDEKSFKCFCR